MTVKEYFQKYLKDSNSVAFIIAKAEKDEASPFYHAIYRTTPMRGVYEWLNGGSTLDYIVLNDKQAPIDWLSGVPWINHFKSGHLINMLIISKEDLDVLYGQEGANSMEKFIEEKIIASH